MTLRSYLFVMLLATVGAWVGLGMVVATQPPVIGALLSLFLFFSILFIALTGTFALIGFLVRFKFHQEELPFQQVALAFRQALSYAAMIVILLILQGKRMLTAANSFFLVGAFVLLELFLLSRGKGDASAKLKDD